MTEKLKQTIEEEIAQLPKEGQEAISAVPWVKIAEEIGAKYNLTEEEIDDFILETLIILIGAADFEFYAINIENHVGTTKDGAKSMADEALERIFKPIRKILEDNIKKNLKIKNPTAMQNVNFILSGGDYSAFMTPNSPLEEYPLGGGGQYIHPGPENLRATPQEGNKKTIIPVFTVPPATTLSLADIQTKMQNKNTRSQSKFTNRNSERYCRSGLENGYFVTAK